jgi:hypothetical protein
VRGPRGLLRGLRTTGVLLALASAAYPQFAPFALVPASLPDDIVGQAYSVVLNTQNGFAPFKSAIVSAGALPPGFSLTPIAGTTSLSIAGTPTQAGTFGFTVTVIDAQGQTASGAYSIRVSTVLAITSTVLNDATAGAPFSEFLQATGGVPPYTWMLGSVSSGGSFGTASARRGGKAWTRRDASSSPRPDLPAGFALSAGGDLTGVPPLPGAFQFQVTVFDSSATNPQSATANLVLNVNPPPTITSPSTLPTGVVGVQYSTPLRAQGGTIPYVWTLTADSLPPGLTLGPGGSLTGVPTQSGNYGFTVAVTDVYGISAGQRFLVVINPAFAITTPSPLAPGAVGTSYSAHIFVTSTTAPYTWSVVAGTLPAGITINPASGIVSGTPTASGNFSFTIQATDGAGHTAVQAYTLVITAPPITIAPASLQPGTVGTPYSQSVAASGGTPPYTFSVGSGSLPGGITLDSAGNLSGTPTAAGTFPFSVSVTDTNQVTVTQSYQLIINPAALPAPTITGVGDTVPPAQQPAISVQLANSYPLPLTGTVTLTFAPATGSVDDPAIQFSTGGRTASFTIPAGQTTAVFSSTAFSLATGTVAGTITLTLDFQADGQDVTPAPRPTRVVTIPPQAPVITAVTASTSSSGISVAVTGFSNTRDMTSATFQFQGAAGTTLQGSQSTIDVSQIFTTWYANSTSAQYGSQFTFTQPFTISGGTSGITSVSVTLTNKQGTSSATSATVQ